MTIDPREEQFRLGHWRTLGVRDVEGLRIRFVESLPEPGPRDHVAWLTRAA